MRNYLSLFLAVLVLACNSTTKPQKPEQLISKEEMINILYDTYVLAAAKGSYKIELEKANLMPQEYIYNKYKVDSVSFLESNAYYAYDMEAYTKMVETVKARMEKEKAHFEKLNDRERATKDSIRKMNKDTSIVRSAKLMAIPSGDELDE